NRRWPPQVVDSLFDQNSHQCRNKALAHRPAFEWHVLADTWAVTLGDQTSFPSHDESGGHTLGGVEHQGHSFLLLFRVYFWWGLVPWGANRRWAMVGWQHQAICCAR